MAEQQVVIASPTIENQQALGSQIEETVTMSTYQIKKAFQQQRADLMTEYERLKGVSITLDVELSVISTRLRDKMQNHLIATAVPILESMRHLIAIGEEGTYFHDNRETEVSLEEVARSLIEVDDPLSSNRYYRQESDTIYVHGRINFFGNTNCDPQRWDDEQCVFAPDGTCKEFELTPEELAHINLVFDTQKGQRDANKQVNDLDLKLKNMGDLTEDIRFAMINEKNKLAGDNSTSQVASKIAEAFINGTDPSTFLLNKE